MIRGEHGTCSSRIINEMLPEIRIMEQCDFLQSIIHSQIPSFLQRKNYDKCDQTFVFQKRAKT